MKKKFFLNLCCWNFLVNLKDYFVVGSMLNTKMDGDLVRMLCFDVECIFFFLSRGN